MEIKNLTKEQIKELQGKYIFHASPILFEVAKPHQAKCYSKKKDNEQFAIYGSPDLNFSIVFAFEKLPKEKFKWSCKYVNGKFMGVLSDETYIAEDAKGYLYCFNKTHFRETEKGSVQYVSKQELKPELVVEVYYKDFKNNFIKEELIKEL